MKRSLVLLMLLALASCQSRSNEQCAAAAGADSAADAQAILAQEKHALDQWSQGNAPGYLDVDAQDVTYFDDIGAQTRLDGIEEMQTYLTALKGKVPPHHYEIDDSKVQLYGDVGVLTLHYKASSLDGKPLMTWKATSVYRKMPSGWRIVHAHWSMVKPMGPGAAAAQ